MNQEFTIFNFAKQRHLKIKTKQLPPQKSYYPLAEKVTPLLHNKITWEH